MKYLVWFLGLVGLIVIGLAVYQSVLKLGHKAGETTADTETVKVVFAKMTETDMEFVYVDRAIAKTNLPEEMIKSALEELIKGPTAAEKAQGLSVSFNAGTVVNSVTISGNTLTVDFNDKFDTPMGGSARVRSISQTIERTIQQFPLDGIGEIKFTINHGERTAVLEP
jgi:spore germination protein GerM